MPRLPSVQRNSPLPPTMVMKMFVELAPPVLSTTTSKAEGHAGDVASELTRYAPFASLSNGKSPRPSRWRRCRLDVGALEAKYQPLVSWVVGPREREPGYGDRSVPAKEGWRSPRSPPTDSCTTLRTMPSLMTPIP